MPRFCQRFCVGLTGGIGSGKTTVADYFATLGAHIVDTDAIAHALTAPQGAAIQPISMQLGAQFINEHGALDRTAMRSAAFSDASVRLTLESILHPLILSHCQLAAAENPTAPYVIFVVPLLVESTTWAARVDTIAVVDCPEITQISRVQARATALGQDIPLTQIESIMQVQATRAERLAAAHEFILNNGDLADMQAQVQALHIAYLDAARLHTTYAIR